jgi:hypothetical protein
MILEVDRTSLYFSPNSIFNCFILLSLEEQSQTFTNKKLAVLWSEKMRLSLDEKYSKIKAGVYREEEEEYSSVLYLLMPL